MVNNRLQTTLLTKRGCVQRELKTGDPSYLLGVLLGANLLEDLRQNVAHFGLRHPVLLGRQETRD